MRRIFARSSWGLLAALACGPAPATSTEGATTSGDGGSTGGPSGSTATPTTGESQPFCVDPQPIFQRDSELPSGFERCANGVVRRVEAVACAVEGRGDCQFGGNECDRDADCADAPHGTCHQTPLIGCVCKYGCGSDAECAPGEICACAGVIGEISQCVPAGCVDDGGCAAGVCALSFGSGGCGSLTARTACIDATSPCLSHADCNPPGEPMECVGCWPEAGQWACEPLPGCGISC